MIDVKAPPYNAVGDGIADDTAAIQAAIVAAFTLGDLVHVPAGDYRVGNLVIEHGIIFEGVSVPNLDSRLSVLRVIGGKNGIIVRRRKDFVPKGPDGNCPAGSFEDPDNPQMCYIDNNGTGTIIRNLTVLGTGAAPATLDGIFIEGAHGVKLENVTVEGVGGNGFHILGVRDAYHNANNWQLENCLAYSCGGNGLLVEGGEAQAGYCVSLDASSNRGWGVAENSGLGSTYVACIASSNAAGSYTVNRADAGTVPVGAANYSTFVACYAEGDNLPDFTQAPYILVVGGNLSAYIVTGSLAGLDLAKIGADQRIGTTWSRLTFREQIPISADGVDTRDVDVTLPDFPPNQQHGTVMTFKYSPMASGREVYVGGQKQPDLYGGAVWNLERYTYHDDNEGLYEGAVPDRCWVMHTAARTSDQTYDEIIPFGWTDRQHPIGPGHFFFGLPVANQKSHWTWRQTIDVALAPGDNPPITPAAGFPIHWLKNISPDSVLAVFTIEASPDVDLAGLNVSVGPHQILGDGTFRMKVFNHSNFAIPQGWLTLVAHFELYTRWSGGGGGF